MCEVDQGYVTLKLPSRDADNGDVMLRYVTAVSNISNTALRYGLIYFTAQSLRKLHVCYKYALRCILSLSSSCSASTMFVYNDVKNFSALLAPIHSCGAFYPVRTL
jgi:hypothetical protein